MLLANQVKMAYFDPSKLLCLFTEASDYFYGTMLTQIHSKDVDKPILEKDHMPIAFLSGKFSSSQVKWSTIEKEAFPIFAMQKLWYLLLTCRGFQIFTEHRNFVFVFKVVPFTSLGRFNIHYNFVVEHIPGSYNIWADILSR
jgi:hypothetical protein